jgi:hypothetical protein
VLHDGDGHSFTVPTEIKPPHALTPARHRSPLEGGIIIEEMMAIPGRQLWAETILAACCKRDTTPGLGIRHALLTDVLDPYRE